MKCPDCGNVINKLYDVGKMWYCSNCGFMYKYDENDLEHVKNKLDIMISQRIKYEKQITNLKEKITKKEYLLNKIELMEINTNDNIKDLVISKEQLLKELDCLKKELETEEDKYIIVLSNIESLTERIINFDEIQRKRLSRTPEEKEESRIRLIKFFTQQKEGLLYKIKIAKTEERKKDLQEALECVERNLKELNEQGETK